MNNDINNENESTALPSADPNETLNPQTDGRLSPEPNSLISYPKEHSAKKKKLLIIVLALIVVVAATAAWIWYTSKEKKEPANNISRATTDIARVRIGNTDGPIGIDALFPKPAPANFANQINFQVFEGLVGYDSQRIVPLLASGWTNPDNSTWVFTLKDNVKFHNGQSVTAQDVKASLDKLVSDKDWGFYLQTISEVKVSGPNQVTIKTSTPDALLLNRLVYGFVHVVNTDGTVSGTGAYTVDTANSKAEDKTRLMAFDNYHQGRPKTRTAEYKVYETKGKITEDLAKGQLDIGETLKNETDKKALAAKGVSGTDYINSGSYGLSLNIARQGGALAKKEVREAVAYALDRDEYQKKSDGTKIATPYIIPKTVVGYDERAGFPDTDIAKSKQLQTAAGYPAGAPLTFLYITDLQAGVPVLIDQLIAAGFKVTPKPMATPRDFVTAARTGAYDILTGSYNSDLGDGLDIFVGLLDSEASQFRFYSNTAFDQMLRDAETAFEPSGHIKKVQEINRYIASEFLWIPVSSNANTIYFPSSYDYRLDSLVGLNGAYLWRVGSF